MERYMLAEPFSGRYRRSINHGGPPYWCEFDYIVTPAAGVDGIDVVCPRALDRPSATYFPHVKRGMKEGWETLKRTGRHLTGVRVEIVKIYVHPSDTLENSARGCRNYGQSFVVDLGTYHCVQVPHSEENKADRQAQAGRSAGGSS
jgi:hypothetical protein